MEYQTSEPELCSRDLCGRLRVSNCATKKHGHPYTVGMQRSEGPDRLVGMVKWFGSRNPQADGWNFGYLVNDGRDFKVRRDDFENAPDTIVGGTPVTFVAAESMPQHSMARRRTKSTVRAFVANAN